jgi:hypothetical protein
LPPVQPLSPWLSRPNPYNPNEVPVIRSIYPAELSTTCEIKPVDRSIDPGFLLPAGRGYEVPDRSTDKLLQIPGSGTILTTYPARYVGPKLLIEPVVIKTTILKKDGTIQEKYQQGEALIIKDQISGYQVSGSLTSETIQRVTIKGKELTLKPYHKVYRYSEVYRE